MNNEAKTTTKVRKLFGSPSGQRETDDNYAHQKNKNINFTHSWHD